MITTERLELRLPVEGDRARFIELFADEEFMAYSDGVLDAVAGSTRFDRMLERAAEVRFAKQPVIERSSGLILGYTGVDAFEYDGQRRLEYGYRLVTQARGRGYATEAGLALLAAADDWADEPVEVMAMIDPRNAPSRSVIGKLEFRYWKTGEVNGYIDDLFLRTIG